MDIERKAVLTCVLVMIVFVGYQLIDFAPDVPKLSCYKRIGSMVVEVDTEGRQQVTENFLKLPPDRQAAVSSNICK